MLKWARKSSNAQPIWCHGSPSGACTSKRCYVPKTRCEVWLQKAISRLFSASQPFSTHAPCVKQTSGRDVLTFIAEAGCVVDLTWWINITPLYEPWLHISTNVGQDMQSGHWFKWQHESTWFNHWSAYYISFFPVTDTPLTALPVRLSASMQEYPFKSPVPTYCLTCDKWETCQLVSRLVGSRDRAEKTSDRRQSTAYLCISNEIGWMKRYNDDVPRYKGTYRYVSRWIDSGKFMPRKYKITSLGTYVLNGWSIQVHW